MAKEEILYKLTTPGGYTRYRWSNRTRWEVGKTVRAKERGRQLCSCQVIHAYRDPYLGILLNPIHANIKNPRLLKVSGTVVADDGTKVGCKEVTALEWLPLPQITRAQRKEIIRRCSNRLSTRTKNLIAFHTLNSQYYGDQAYFFEEVAIRVKADLLISIIHKVVGK